jgi:hypothetical protein
MLTTAIEGAIVSEAKGVYVSTLTDKTKKQLAVGSELKFGDVLHIGAGAQLVLKHGEKMLRTPKDGAAAPRVRQHDKLVASTESWQLLVTGPSAADYLPKDAHFGGTMAPELLKVLRRAGEAKNGTAGAPLPLTALPNYPGAKPKKPKKPLPEPGPGPSPELPKE